MDFKKRIDDQIINRLHQLARSGDRERLIEEIAPHAAAVVVELVTLRGTADTLQKSVDFYRAMADPNEPKCRCGHPRRSHANGTDGCAVMRSVTARSGDEVLGTMVTANDCACGAFVASGA